MGLTSRQILETCVDDLLNEILISSAILLVDRGHPSLELRDLLRCQLGVDGRYTTEYYAQGWNPATAQFYNQREKQIGDYIKADLFLNAKWKRMRIFLKLEHANEDMFGSRHYFTVPDYPLNRRIFKYGFSWSFYD